MMAVVWLTVVTILPGCAYTSYGRADTPTLAESSYRAADMLSQQTQGRITRDTTIHVGPVADIDKPAAVTAFGRTVGSQLAARFVQLGYGVDASSYDEMNGGAPQMAPPVAAPLYGGGAYGSPPAAPSSVTMTGQYAVAKREILVNLRFLDTASNKVVAAYDYSLPLTSDLKQLTRIAGENKGLFGF
jgi:hypothetical protein